MIIPLVEVQARFQLMRQGDPSGILYRDLAPADSAIDGGALRSSCSSLPPDSAADGKCTCMSRPATYVSRLAFTC